MPVARPALALSLYNHHSDRHYETLVEDRVLERARRLTILARENGLGALKAASDPLIEIGMEVNERGDVAKNSLGVLDLSWQAAEHPEWAEMIRLELEAIRSGIRTVHGVELKQVIWAGMGGSAEDKAMYGSLGMLERVPVYILDSTDPAKLEAILKRITADGGSLQDGLRRTLVVGMAMGMTSYEPVINLEMLDRLYQKLKIPSAANFLYMTLPGSLLDQFAGPRGYRRIELQPDRANTTAGRHSGPLTRGSLYPLGLNDVDLDAWIQSTVLCPEQTEQAFRLAAFLHGNGVEGRDKVTLLLPRDCLGMGIWTKQDFEESLGKSEGLGIKIFPRPFLRPSRHRPVQDRAQDRVFWAVQIEGRENPDPAGIKALRRRGYPVAVLELSGPMPVPRFMQWVHYVVFGIGWLRRMNFVTQPGVELYKAITNKLYSKARRLGKVEATAEWRAMARSRYRTAAPGGIRLYYDSLIAAGLADPEDLGPAKLGAAEILARAVRRLVEQRRVEYAEVTFYGDTRYRREGIRLRQALSAGAETSFGDQLGLSSDVYEGPAMNHSYHEMIIGHGRCFSIVALARKQVTIRSIDYRPDYHKAQWLATKLALEQRRRPVVALTFPDLSRTSTQAVQSFFRTFARRLGAAR